MTFNRTFFTIKVGKFPRLRHVRLYKNGKQWVERMHPETATQFATEAEARAVVSKFNLADAEIVKRAA